MQRRLLRSLDGLKPFLLGLDAATGHPNCLIWLYFRIAGLLGRPISAICGVGKLGRRADCGVSVVDAIRTRAFAIATELAQPKLVVRRMTASWLVVHKAPAG